MPNFVARRTVAEVGSGQLAKGNREAKAEGKGLWK